MPMPREQPSVGSEPGAAGLLGAFANYMDTSGAKAAAKPAAEMTLAELSRGIRGIIRAPYFTTLIILLLLKTTSKHALEPRLK